MESGFQNVKHYNIGLSRIWAVSGTASLFLDKAMLKCLDSFRMPCGNALSSSGFLCDQRMGSRDNLNRKWTGNHGFRCPLEAILRLWAAVKSEGSKLIIKVKSNLDSTHFHRIPQVKRRLAVSQSLKESDVSTRAATRPLIAPNEPKQCLECL